MKDGLSSFDVLAVVAEFQVLVGGFVDKVYQRDDEIVLKVNVPSSGKREVYAKVGKWLCLRDIRLMVCVAPYTPLNRAPEGTSC